MAQKFKIWRRRCKNNSRHYNLKSLANYFHLLMFAPRTWGGVFASLLKGHLKTCRMIWFGSLEISSLHTPILWLIHSKLMYNRSKCLKIILCKPSKSAPSLTENQPWKSCLYVPGADSQIKCQSAFLYYFGGATTSLQAGLSTSFTNRQFLARSISRRPNPPRGLRAPWASPWGRTWGFP